MSKKKNGSTATLAEVAAQHNEANEAKEAIVIQDRPETVDIILSKVTSGWTKEESRLTHETVGFAIDTLTKAKEGLMSVGEKFNTLRATLTPDHFRSVVKSFAAMKIEGLSENNIGLWMTRAKVLKLAIPNKLVRQAILLHADSRGIVIRKELTDKEKEAGDSPYQLSANFEKALKENPVPNATKQSDAEAFAKQLVGKVEREPRKASQAKQSKRLKGMFKKFVTDWKANAGANLLFDFYQIFVQEIEDTDIAMNLVGRMDKVLNAATENAKGQAA